MPTHRVRVQSAGLSSLMPQLLRRAREVLEQVELTPARSATTSPTRRAPSYLVAASELLFYHVADLIADSAKLAHDNERRWRTHSASLSS